MHVQQRNPLQPITVEKGDRATRSYYTFATSVRYKSILNELWY